VFNKRKWGVFIPCWRVTSSTTNRVAGLLFSRARTKQWSCSEVDDPLDIRSLSNVFLRAVLDFFTEVGIVNCIGALSIRQILMTSTQCERAKETKRRWATGT
jgi:hypothetical protein